MRFPPEIISPGHLPRQPSRDAKTLGYGKRHLPDDVDVPKTLIKEVRHSYRGVDVNSGKDTLDLMGGVDGLCWRFEGYRRVTTPFLYEVFDGLDFASEGK